MKFMTNNLDAMRNLKWKEPIIAHQMAQRKPELLANQVKEWMATQPK